jgi:hypothetical protein
MKIKYVLLVLVAFRACSFRSTSADGLKAYESGDYQRAIVIWRPLAEAGNADAAQGLTQIYESIKGFENQAEASKWLRKGAQSGNAYCQYRLAMTCGDPVEATEWLRRAAIQGSQWAQDWLWQAYLNGDGVPKNIEEAYFWALLVKARNGPIADYNIQWMEEQLGRSRVQGKRMHKS